MEDNNEISDEFNNEFNIYYQYNSRKEIEKPKLKKDNTYLLLEYQRREGDNLNYKKLEKLLEVEGVNFKNIKQVLVEDNRSNKNEMKLTALSENNFNDYKNDKNIYLHFLIDEDECSQKNEYIKEIEQYKNKIKGLEEKFQKISEEMNDIRNSNVLSDINIPEILKDIGKESSDPFKSLKNSINANSSVRNSLRQSKRGKKSLYILYLYCSIFDLKILNYEETDYVEEIKCLYNIFKRTPNISATLIFEPIINLINNFNDYFEDIPDIIHINLNPNCINEELNYNNLGETINIKVEDLFKKLGDSKKISKVKLIILSISHNNKVNEIVEKFKNVKSIIFPNNLKRQNEKFLFYQEFYKNLLLKKFSLKKCFDSSNYNNSFTFRNPENQEICIYVPITSLDENTTGEIKNDITINNNCPLNLGFVKYNYHRIVGRNNEINTCIEKIKEKTRCISVVGSVGAGKKSLVQIVGKYFFERNYFNDIQYIELYDLDDIEEILKTKINQFQEDFSSINEGEISSDFSKKILLIIIFNSIISEKADLRNIEDTINSIKNKNPNFIFLYTCTVDFSIEKNSLNKTSIKLDKLKGNNVLSLLEYINGEIFDYKEKKKTNGFKKLKKLSDYPNYFFLEAIFFKKYGIEKALKQKYLNGNKTNVYELLNEFIREAEKEFNLENILPIFYIMKLGIRDDILHIFFKEKEIDIIKNHLYYLIMLEEDSEGNNYYLDGYFKQKLQLIIEEKYKNKNNTRKEFYKKYLLRIMENYAKIFRYIINNSNFDYNLCKEFHAGINQGFWFSLYESNFKDKYNVFSESQNEKKIYFDDIRYFNNIKSIFEDGNYFGIIKENIKDFKEYISQIVVCFSTILHFIKNTHLLKKILDIFERSLTELKLEKDILRLKYFKYWSLGDPTFLPDEGFIEKIESQEKKNKNLYNEMKFEINLIKIYNLKKENIDYKSSRYPSFEECQIYSKNDPLNLIRLNILYGIAFNSEDKKYFIEANNLSKQMNDNDLKILTLIELAEYFLKHLEFDEFNKCIRDCEILNEEKNSKSNKFVIFMKKIEKLIADKNEKYKNNIKNKLLFYISEPFFYKLPSYCEDEEENNLQLKTEANNSFSLKYNLKLELPKDLEITFEFITKDFLDNLEIKFQNPLKFVYIGSDHYNKEGELFYSDNESFNAIPFSLKTFENTIKKFKNKTDMIILGFINSEKIAKYFRKNHFPNVIYLQRIDELLKIFDLYPYFYFYFQRCFYSFIINFLLKLDKKRIIDAFSDSKKEFKEQLFKLGNLYTDLFDKIDNLVRHDIIIYDYGEWEEEKYLFEELNISRSNSLASNINKISDEIISEENIIKEFEVCKKEKKIGNKIELENFKMDAQLSNNIFELLINKRYYGNKPLFGKIINEFYKHNIINIFGKAQTGKTALCLELCKYFYMNNHFKKGIYYISNIYNKKWEKKDELKDLITKENNDKNIDNDKVLIIYDDINNLNNCLKMLNPNLYFIIVTEESLKNTEITIDKKDSNNKTKDSKKQKDKNNKRRKSSSNETKNILDNIGFINMNIILSINFKEEFIDYLKINLFMNDNIELIKKAENNLNTIKENDEVYIYEIVKLINKDL